MVLRVYKNFLRINVFNEELLSSKQIITVKYRESVQNVKNYQKNCFNF